METKAFFEYLLPTATGSPSLSTNERPKMKLSRRSFYSLSTKERRKKKMLRKKKNYSNSFL